LLTDGVEGKSMSDYAGDSDLDTAIVMYSIMTAIVIEWFVFMFWCMNNA